MYNRIISSPLNFFGILLEIFTFTHYFWALQRFFYPTFSKGPSASFWNIYSKYKIFYIDFMQFTILNIFVSSLHIRVFYQQIIEWKFLSKHEAFHFPPFLKHPFCPPTCIFSPTDVFSAFSMISLELVFQKWNDWVKQIVIFKKFSMLSNESCSLYMWCDVFLWILVNEFFRGSNLPVDSSWFPWCDLKRKKFPLKCPWHPSQCCSSLPDQGQELRDGQGTRAEGRRFTCQVPP